MSNTIGEQLSNFAKVSSGPVKPNGKRAASDDPSPGRGKKKKFSSGDNTSVSTGLEDDQVSVFAPSDVSDADQPGYSQKYSRLDNLLSITNNFDNSNEGNSSCNSDQEEDNDPLESLVTDFKQNDMCHDKIDKKLADAINSVWTEKQSKEKLKEHLKKHYRPENCEKLIVNKVNPEIFNVLKSGTKSLDIKLQKEQTYVLKSAIPIAKSLDLLCSMKSGEKISSDNLKNLKQFATDSLGMLSCLNQNVLKKRRDKICSTYIQKDYRQLKYNVPADSKLLFGDDIKARLSLIKATAKARNQALINTDPSGRAYLNSATHTNNNSNNFNNSKNSNTGSKNPARRSKNNWYGNKKGSN